MAVKTGEALAEVRSLSSHSEAESVWQGFGTARAEVVAAVHQEFARPPLSASARAAARQRRGGACAASGGRCRVRLARACPKPLPS